MAEAIGVMARTPSTDLEANILTAASELLAEVGAGGVTQRAVAKRAGVSPQSIYNRFADKHDLLDALANRAFVDLTRQLAVDGDVALDTFTDPVANMVEGLARYRRFAIAEPRRYGLMSDADVPGFQISDRTLGTAFGSLKVLIDAVARAIDADRLDHDDPAAAHGALRFELTDIGVVADRAAHDDAVVTTIPRGLGADGRTPQS
ncbi:MAG: TetR/AcrR family transcriptional regulator [Actinomycetota bacterium]